MIIRRYLTKEILITMMAVTLILLLIFLSNQFVRYLSQAALGQMPVGFILKLMILEIPHLLSLLLPLGLFLGILLSFGRLYADSEMVVLFSCGLKYKTLVKITMTLALVVALIISVLTLWLSPKVIADRTSLRSQAKTSSIIDLVIPGRFQQTHSGKRVIYVESISRDRTVADNIFLAQKIPTSSGELEWRVMTAKHATTKIKEGNRRFVEFQQGVRYEGIPGHRNFEKVSYKTYGIKIPDPPVVKSKDIDGLSTTRLFKKAMDNNPEAMAILQWRISIPLMAIVLAFIAIPLSRLKPRSGKYSKILPAAIVYILYANLMFIARDWLETEKVPAIVGIWWLHLSVVLFGLWLYRSQNAKFKLLGWFRRT